MSDTFIEQKSRLVSLVYRVLETLELPPLEASEGEILAALASAFYRNAQIAVQAERDVLQGKPAVPKDTRMFSARPPVAPPAFGPLRGEA